MEVITVPATVESAAKVISVTIKAIKYINEGKNALKERATLAAEATSPLSLLLEFPPPASHGIKALARLQSPTGPWNDSNHRCRT